MSSTLPHHLRSLFTTVLAAVLAMVPGLIPAALAKDSVGNRQWVATWAVSPQRAPAPLAIDGQTLRQVVHVSLGGKTVRVRFSNAYGTAPLVIGTAHVALSAAKAGVDIAEPLCQVTYQHPSVTSEVTLTLRIAEFRIDAAAQVGA